MQKRMRNGMHDSFFSKKKTQLKDVGSQHFNLIRLGLIQVPSQKMYLAAVLRKISRYLHARNKALQTPQLLGRS